MIFGDGHFYSKKNVTRKRKTRQGSDRPTLGRKIGFIKC